jgi:hypothetical protein
VSDLDDELDAAGKAWLAQFNNRASTAAKAVKPAKRGTPEMDAQKAVVSWLRKAGCIVSRNINELQSNERDPNKRARFWMSLVKSGCTKGFPDISAILPGGATVFIEMKAPKGVVSDTQAAIHEELRRRGAVVVVGRDIWSVQSALAEQGVRI